MVVKTEYSINSVRTERRSKIIIIITIFTINLNSTICVYFNNDSSL